MAKVELLPYDDYNAIQKFPVGTTAPDRGLQMPRGISDEEMAAKRGGTSRMDTDAILRELQGDPAAAAARSSQGYNASTTRRGTGNAKADWMSLVSGLSPSVQSIAQVFPQFLEMYPGSSYERADIKGPWGWFDSIADLGSGDVGKKWQTYSGSSKKSGSTQFSDPLTRQYEQLLQSQTDLYRRQQADLDAEAKRKQATRAETDAAVKRLTDFLNKRVDSLGQPAYTDSEANVITTRMLDPLEADRDASQRRALDRISYGGYLPTSGIAQQLTRDVDREYDKTRSRAHGDIAYEQIQEERSREQETQDLLKYLAQLPEASARGDLDFVNYLNDVVARPGEKALTSSALLSDLPVQRAQLAMQALGLGGQPINSVNGALSLLNNSQQNRLYDNRNTSSFWQNIGLSF